MQARARPPLRPHDHTTAPARRLALRPVVAASLLACTLTIAGLPGAQAAGTSWIAPDGGSWETAANWSAGVPGPADLAIVSPPTRPVGGVIIGAATTIGGLSMARVNLGVRADLTVTGAVSWYEDPPAPAAGILAFSNAPLVQWQGPVALTGNGMRGINNTGVLDLSGPTDWSGNTADGPNSIFIGVTSPNTVVRNRGVFTDANGFDTILTGLGTFDNLGNFTKSGASTTRVDVARFVNAGSVTVTAGTLSFPALTGEQTGSWHVEAGALLDLGGGTPTLRGPMSGAGTVRLGGGTVTVEGAGRSVGVRLDGATLTGTDHVFDGPFTWRTGSIAGVGTTALTGTVTLGTTEPLVIGDGRVLASYGQMHLSGGQISVGQGGTGQTSRLANLGTLHDAGTGSRRLQGLAPELSSFVNAGSYVKTSAGMTFVSGLQFDNSGLLDVQAGLMRVSSPLANSGTVRVAAGAGLLMTSITGLDNRGTLTGDGAMDHVLGIVNRGIVSPGDAIGTLTMGDLVLAPEGMLKIELGADGAHDLLSLTGAVSFGGTLALGNSGFTPQAGASFTVMTYAERLGDSTFESVTLNGFGSDVRFDVVYGATELRLNVVVDPGNLPPIPEPGTWAMWLAGLAFVGLRAVRRPTWAAS